MSTEKRLIKTLLRTYNAVGLYGRPVNSWNETERVYYGVALIDATLVNKYQNSALLALNVWDRYVSIHSVSLFLFHTFIIIQNILQRVHLYAYINA